MAGFGLSLRNYWLLRYKPIHERQAKLQEGLKKALVLGDEHHFSKAVNQLRSNQMPSQQGKEQLANLIEFLRPHVNDYIAPTPPQVSTYLATLRAAVEEWDNVLKPPGSDRIFTDGDAEGRARLLVRLERVQDDTKAIIDGITTIQKKPLGTRKQQRLFSALATQLVPPALPAQGDLG